MVLCTVLVHQNHVSNQNNQQDRFFYIKVMLMFSLVLPGRAVTNMWAKAMLYTNSVVPTPEHETPVIATTKPTTTTTTTTASPKSKEEEQTHSPLIDVRISSECGQSSVVQPLVVNGQATNEGEFPWLTALMYRKGFNYEFRCTANLVSDRHIITGNKFQYSLHWMTLTIHYFSRSLCPIV